jgi:hypothetical protein
MDLSQFELIDTVEKFSILPAKGRVIYINRYTEEKKIGGMLIKVFKENDRWYCLLLNNKKFYKVSYNSNHIYYKGNTYHIFRQYITDFVSN